MAQTHVYVVADVVVHDAGGVFKSGADFEHSKTALCLEGVQLLH